MIHYALRCGQDHAFDGWFKDSRAFDVQVGQRIVECPICGSKDVNRALMAPSLGRGRDKHRAVAESRERAAPAEPATPPMTAASGPIPDQMRAMLQKLRSEVEKNCDYVGPAFAEEARKIHRGESDKRGIYGETTPDQAESLADEGIEVASIPWVPRAES